MPDYDIGEAFKAIEDELIDSMIRNMKRHRAEEVAEGFEWEQWQALQMEALEEYRRKNAKRFQGRFSKINGRLAEAIQQARKNGQTQAEADILEALQKGFRPGHSIPEGVAGTFFRINDRKLDALINATTNDMKRAEVAILRHADDQYRKAIFNAQVYANTGAGTYEKAVDMATRDMLASGLNCVEYSNGSRHRLKEYAQMALKTATTRAYLAGEADKREEWGIHTVIVNKRNSACPKCAPFCGRVLIDDVWGSGTAQEGDYPLLSSAIASGLYHPNCKDVHTTYFEGISGEPERKWKKAELEELKEKEWQEQKRKYAENQAEKYERLTKYSLDPENKQKYQERTGQWAEQAEKLRQVNHEETAETKVSNFKAGLSFTAPDGHDIIITKKQLGKKIGRHARDYGLDPSTLEGQQEFINRTRDIIQNRDELRLGEWRGQEGKCEFHIKGDDVVVTNKGNYVTTLKGGVENARVKNARKQKI